jgi:hypothetical protein
VPDQEFLKYQAMGIAGLLRTRQLAVPFYQRSYSWRSVEDTEQASEGPDDKLQVEDYWADLSASFFNRSSYFLGTVVIARDASGDRHLVIDGQQRLATTSLLLAAIRDEFANSDHKEFADSTQQEYLGKFDRRAGKEQPKLILNSDDRDFYERRVVGRDASVTPINYSQRLLHEAYGYLSARVQEFKSQHGTEARTKLNELADWLDGGAQIVSIEVATEADAFLIFETLNDRGADLTVADLLKNYLFSQASARLDEVRDSWVSTLTNLDVGKVGNRRFTSFARQFLSSKYGRTREREVYGKLKGIVTGPAAAVSFAQELKDSSRIYYALLTSDSDFWADYSPRVAAAADVLVELNLEQYRPLMLAALATFDKSEIERLVPAMVAWIIRGLAAGKLGAGSAETAFCEAATEIRAGRVTTTDQILKTRVGDLIPSDEAFKNDFEQWKVTRGSLARYLLRALELEERGDQEPELVVNEDADSVNLEHILPKNAKEVDWPKFTADEQRAFVHRLGNLCLLQKGPNGRIGNRSWTVKQPILASSALELTEKASAAPDWTKSAISSRQRELAGLAVRVWPRTPRA